MRFHRSPIAVGALTSALLAGCADPDQPTDLRTDGPPSVPTVLVLSDLRTALDPDFPRSPFDLDRLIESATYCRVGDDKRPDIVNLPTISTLQVCPADLAAPADDAGVAQAAPPSWYTRIVFDELLDPSVEDLIPEVDAMNQPTGRVVGSLRATQPVAVTCGGEEVPYDGYYVPNGNRISWPVGPSLFIQPLVPGQIPTGATCTVTVRDKVHNKAGQPVPDDQRSYLFQIGPMAFRFSSPDPAAGDPGTITLDPGVPVRFFWTAPFSTVPAASDVHIFAAPNLGADTGDGMPDLGVCSGGGTAVAAADIVIAARAPSPGDSDATTAATTALIMELGLASPAPRRWAENTTYRIEIGAGVTVTPAQGGPDGTFPAGYQLCFHTTAAAM